MNQLLYPANPRFGPGGRMSMLLGCVLTLTLMTNVWLPIAVHATNAPFIHITAPQQVQVDEPILVTLSLDAPVAIGGYQAALSFDTTIAQFAGTEEASDDPPALLGPIETPSGVAWGTVACAVQPCAPATTGVAQHDANQPLQTTLRLIARQPGRLEIAVGQVVVLDANGKQLLVALSQPTAMIQVGVSNSTTMHRAPALPPTLAAQGPPALATSADHPGNGQVSNMDMTEAALAWTFAQEQGDACSSSAEALDLDADGCITVADVQRVAARVQPSTRFAQPHMDGIAQPNTAPQATTAGTTFVVNTIGDGMDVNNGDGVCATKHNYCSLRAAITEANHTPGPNTITFDIPGDGVHTIQLTKRLPGLNDLSGGTTINGYTQPGAAPNTDPLVSNARINVQIAGEGLTKFGALPITSPNNVVHGLALFNLRRGIILYGADARNNVITGMFVGTDAAGNNGASSYVSVAYGVTLQQGASNNRIGGTALADRNVISGNGRHGVATFDRNTNNNMIINNVIGLSPRGDRRVPNRRNGIDINTGSSYNIIGGTDAGTPNLVSGNDLEGIELSHSTDTVGNRVVGNFVGTDPSGTRVSSDTANLRYGVHIEDGANNNLVADNVIGGNAHGGISVDDHSSVQNHIYNNYIGVARNGNAIPNSAFGVQVTRNANQTRIGPNNIIAHNPVGVQITSDQSDRNTITQNTIFSNTSLGIDLGPEGVNGNDQHGHDGPNQRLNFPVLRNATATYVFGTACAGCRVEIFIADRDAGVYGQGKQFVGATTASTNGTFVVFIDTIAVGTALSATATDADGNTSEFGRNIVVGSAQ